MRDVGKITTTMVSLAEYVRALKANELDSLAGSPTTCPHCRSEVVTGILISIRRELHCPGCAPTHRQCASCRRSRLLTAFDVTKNPRLGFRIESYCVDCRRTKGRRQYHDAKSLPTPIAGSAQCTQCRKMKPRSHFYVDKRYAGGLLMPCKRCKLEKEKPST